MTRAEIAIAIGAAIALFALWAACTYIVTMREMARGQAIEYEYREQEYEGVRV